MKRVGLRGGIVDQVKVTIGLVALLLAASCGSSTSRPKTAVDVQAAVTATVHAKGFVLISPGVEVTYQAPDRVRQVEHGQSSSSDQTAVVDTTITKVFIDDGYYEATQGVGEPATFTKFARCPQPDNAADSLLGALRSAHLSSISGDGATYSATIDNHGQPVAVTGHITVEAGFVKTVSFGGPGPTRSWTFSAYDRPNDIPVPAAAATNGQRTC